MKFLLFALIGFSAGLMALATLAWISRPIIYSGIPFEGIQQFLSSWGRGLDERGKIVVRAEGAAGSVQLVKHRYKARSDLLNLRCRNADESRAHFQSVAPALIEAGIHFETELTKKRRRVRALCIPFEVNDPLAPAAAAHAARVILAAMGGRPSGPYSVYYEGRFRRDLNPGDVQFIPPTKSAKAGFSMGRLLGRLVALILGRQ